MYGCREPWPPMTVLEEKPNQLGKIREGSGRSLELAVRGVSFPAPRPRDLCHFSPLTFCKIGIRLPLLSD